MAKSTSPVSLLVGTTHATHSGMSEKIKSLWLEYRSLPDDKKEIAARGIVARLFGEAEHSTDPNFQQSFFRVAAAEVEGAK